RPWSPRLPAWLVRLGALMLRTEPELALTGRRCLPERLVESHFKFLYTNLESALADLLGPRASEPEPRVERWALIPAKGMPTIDAGRARERKRLSAAPGTR
ncbi:MAG TPA: DUF1731 domain-containing protein, partial [Pyrinomonadaceae bacterium]